MGTLAAQAVLTAHRAAVAIAANLKRDPAKRPNPFTYEDFMPGEASDAGEMNDVKMHWKLGMMGLGPKNRDRVVNF